MIRYLCSAIAALALLAGSAEAVLADALVADGDGIAPITGTKLDFGQICHGQPVSFDALVGIKATGHPNNKQVFEDGTTVTLSAAVLDGDGLSVSGPATMVMASDWRSQPNNSWADPVSFTVTLTPTELGNYSGKIEFSADGTNRLGDPISRTDNLNVKAKVLDCTGPVFANANDITVEATGPSGAEVTFEWPTATDAVDGLVPTNCDLASPVGLPIGSTLVTCTAQDDADNESVTSFAISVVDSTPPAIDDAPADQEVEGDDSGTAVVDWELPTAWDAVDGSVQVECDPPSGSTFAGGTTLVTCQAEDEAGNVAALSFSVTVQVPQTDPGTDTSGDVSDSDGGPVQGELPDSAMDKPSAPLVPIGLALLLGAGIAARRRLAGRHPA